MYRFILGMQRHLPDRSWVFIKSPILLAAVQACNSFQVQRDLLIFLCDVCGVCQVGVCVTCVTLMSGLNCPSLNLHCVMLHAHDGTCMYINSVLISVILSVT